MGSKLILDADRKVAKEVLELPRNKLVDVSMYYIILSRLETSAIVTSRKWTCNPNRVQDRAGKRAHVERSVISRNPLSAAPVTKNKNVLMEIVSD